VLALGALSVVLLTGILITLERLRRTIIKMATNQAAFDAILNPFLAAVTTYITDAEAALAAAGTDLTPEANAVTAGATALAAAQAALPLATPPTS